MRWENTDLEAGMVKVPRAKPGDARYVVLNDRAVEILRGELARNAHDKPWVWTGERAERAKNHLSQFWFAEKVWRPALTAAGIENFRWHDLRHTFGSLMTMAGVHPRTLQELMGHKTLQMTQRYSHSRANTNGRR